MPFLAISGNHGTITSMAKMGGGIEIWLQQLNSVDIASDGKTARFGGGILNKEAKEALWAAGKQAGESFLEHFGCSSMSSVG